MTALSRHRERQTLEPEFALALENKLKMSLRPVRPDPQFVDHLHTRLSSPQVVLEKRNTALSMLLIAMSLAGGVFLLLITRRWRHRLMPTA